MYQELRKAKQKNTTNKNNKNKKAVNRKTVYIRCILAMLVLLVVAVLGPQLLFVIQDRHTQGSTWQGERDRMDMTTLNESYTAVRRDRMSDFAKGLAEGKKYYATATDYQVDEECYKILEELMLSDWNVNAEMGLVLDYVNALYSMMYSLGFEVDMWKRYVIYDKDFENGVAFMAWYYEINVGDIYRIKLLIDTEDDTLYYVQFLQKEENVKKTGWQISFSAEEPELLTYFWYYYEPDLSESDLYETILVDMNDGSYNIILPYGENSLHWEIEATEGDISTLNLGIVQIANLIPEFK